MDGKGFERGSRLIFGASTYTVMHRKQCNESGNYFDAIAHIPCMLAYKVPLVSRYKNIKINYKKAVT